MIDFENKRVLVIAPHMDDEVIGCSGTLMAMRDQIAQLIVVHMSDDECRINEFENISKILNIDEHYRLGCEDGFVRLSYKKAVMKLIEIIQSKQIDIVFIPHAEDEHVDHIATHEIAMDAIGKARYWVTPYQTCHVMDVFEYEVWSFQKKVSVCINITEFIDIKKQMMSYYASQLEFDYIKFIEYINGYRGLSFNKQGYMECFSLVRI